MIPTTFMVLCEECSRKTGCLLVDNMTCEKCGTLSGECAWENAKPESVFASSLCEICKKMKEGVIDA
jgi:hypothetical protein